MFKGYIPTNGKRPAEKIKDREDFYTLDKVQHLKCYGGVLQNDVILVDLDTPEEADLMYKIVQDLELKCNVIKTTRGMHFYFKNSGVKTNAIHKRAAIGITVDIKVGSKPTVIPLKIDGKVREYLQIVEELGPLPKWLFVVKQAKDFNELGPGDGRNQALFNYILTLQADGFTKHEARETITIINNHMLKEPLEDQELELITRDEAFTKDIFYKGSQLLHDRFATFLKSEENIVKINGALHVYNQGIYSDKILDIEKVMIKHIKILTKAKRSEVLAYLELIAPARRLSGGNFILVDNGILNIETHEITPFNFEYVCKNKIPFKFVPGSYHKDMDKTLNKIACNDRSLRLLLEEMVGYCLLRRNELGKSFILTGEGSNGKSTILDIMKAFLGEVNVSAISLDEINQRFKTAEIYGKLANIGDDISNKYLDDNAVFKKLVTGETVNVERKGKDPFDFNNYGKLVFSANEIPRINDTSNGLMRRLVIVPFRAKFSVNDEDFDPFIKDKLMSQEAMEYLLIIALEGLNRVLKNNAFTEVAAVKKELVEYERLNNPVVAFVEEVKIENEVTKDIYLKYSIWCEENRLKALSQIQFGREITKRGYKSKQVRVNGERFNIYVKQEE